MKSPVVTFRADRGKRVVSAVCLSLSAIAMAGGYAANNIDLVAATGIMLLLSAVTFLVADSIVIDGRKHVIRRQKGIWPIINESTRPFSDVDHVCLEEVQQIESDGSEVVVSRLTLVRKFGSPIVLANECEPSGALRKEAHILAKLIGVEARTAA